MEISGPTGDCEQSCERILRTLPRWFGLEESLLAYARAATEHPTFLFTRDGNVVAFITAKEHFAASWEVHCFAVDASHRNRGIGTKLHRHVETWLREKRVAFLQVKTMAATCPSPEYAETRKFYEHIGYVPIELFPELWGPRLPVLQMIKPLSRG